MTRALWKVMEKCEVAPMMLSVVKSFHDAEVRVGSTTTERFVVKNGLRQGYTLAPSLFTIYFSGMVPSWRSMQVKG